MKTNEMKVANVEFMGALVTDKLNSLMGYRRSHILNERELRLKVGEAAVKVLELNPDFDWTDENLTIVVNKEAEDWDDVEKVVNMKGYDELDKALEDYFNAYEMISDEDAERIEAEETKTNGEPTELTVETVGRKITYLLRAYNNIHIESLRQKEFQVVVDAAARIFFEANPDELTEETVEDMADGMMDYFEGKVGYKELYDALEKYFDYSE